MGQSNCLEEIMESEKSTSMRGPTCKKRSAQCRPARKVGQVSRRNHGWWRSPWRLLVDRRELHSSSSCRTSSSAPRAKGRINSQYHCDPLDMIRRTHTTLDVLREKPKRRLLEHWWAIETYQNLGPGVTQFTRLNEKLLDGYMRSGGRLTKNSSNFWTWSPVTRNLVRHVGSSSTKEKSSNGPSRNRRVREKLRGIYFGDPDDEEFEETIENARNKLELPVEAAMPCKLKTMKSSFRHRETCGESDNRKSNHAYIVEAHESARKRVERTFTQRSWRSHCREGGQFIGSLQSCAQVYHHASSNDNPGCKIRCGQRVGEARTIAGFPNDQK